MDKIAFVFSGQGAQYPGMGKELYEISPAAKKIFDTADSVRPGTSSQCFSGTPEELMMTKNTQPCIFCVDIAAAKALEERDIKASAAAGFSLGEVAALTFADTLSERDGFELVCARGALMNDASVESKSVMAAVLKLDNRTVENLCGKYSDVYPVNYNCPGQLVAAGTAKEMDMFKNEVKNAKGKFFPLAVSGGFHSPFMNAAASNFASKLKKYDFHRCRIPVYSNFTAKPYDISPKKLLEKQMRNPVRWQETIENMISDGISVFIETGPGKILCGLIEKISKEVAVYNVEDAASLEFTVKEISGKC